eukprot:639511-Prorocentrum_minimum.AAC.1
MEDAGVDLLPRMATFMSNTNTVKAGGKISKLTSRAAGWVGRLRNLSIARYTRVFPSQIISRLLL